MNKKADAAFKYFIIGIINWILITLLTFLGLILWMATFAATLITFAVLAVIEIVMKIILNIFYFKLLDKTCFERERKTFILLVIGIFSSVIGLIMAKKIMNESKALIKQQNEEKKLEKIEENKKEVDENPKEKVEENK